MEPKKIDVAPEMLEKSLRCCAEENPAPAGHEPCEDCYLWQLHLVKGGRVSTGETCFQNLVGEAFACVRRLNDFDQSQSKILLEKLEQARAELADQTARANICEHDAKAFREDRDRLFAEVETLKKGLQLSIETHSVDPKQVERLTRYYIQQAKTHEGVI